MIKNMTPHEINVVDNDGNKVKSFPSDGLIRLSVSVEPAGSVDGIPASVSKFGTPEGLPEYSPGTYYIVSQLVKAALPERTDLLVPAEMVRDAAGQIIGCKSLGR